MKKKKNNIRENNGRDNVFITSSQKEEVVERMKKMYQEDFKPEEIKIRSAKKLMSVNLKNLPDEKAIAIINDTIFINVLDDNSITYKEIVDLTQFRFIGNIYLFAIDFMGWLNSLEEHLLKTSSNPNEVSIDFISQDELEFSLVLECATMEEGLKMVEDMYDEIDKRSSEALVNFNIKYNADALLQQEESETDEN